MLRLDSARYGQHAKWVDHIVKNQTVLNKVGITLNRFLGKGEFGCAFETTKGDVLKLTDCHNEAATWDIIAEEQRRNFDRMLGIAEMMRRPFGISLPGVRKKPVFGILREPIASVPRHTDRLYRGLSPIRAPKFVGDSIPLHTLRKMVDKIPEARLMAASIEHLYIVTGGIYLLSDIHTSNVGIREDERLKSGIKWLVLRDPGWAATPSGDNREFDYWQPQGMLEIR